MQALQARSPNPLRATPSMKTFQSVLSWSWRFHWDSDSLRWRIQDQKSVAGISLVAAFLQSSSRPSGPSRPLLIPEVLSRANGCLQVRITLSVGALRFLRQYGEEASQSHLVCPTFAFRLTPSRRHGTDFISFVGLWDVHRGISANWVLGMAQGFASSQTWTHNSPSQVHFWVIYWLLGLR